jgi:ABC-type transport system substrate-binding protein
MNITWEKAKELLTEAGYPDGLTISLNLPDGSEKQTLVSLHKTCGRKSV